MNQLANTPILRSFVFSVALWLPLALPLADAARAHYESDSRAAAPVAVAAKGSFISAEKFSLYHLDVDSGFSFASAQYSGQIELQNLFPDGVPPTAILSIKFPNVGAAIPIKIRLNEAKGYSEGDVKLSYVENPFPSSPYFDFGAKNGVKAPSHFATDDPELFASFQIVKNKRKNISGLKFKIKTYARAGGEFNVIQGYVPPCTAGMNNRLFRVDMDHHADCSQQVLIELGVPGQNFLQAKIAASGGGTVREAGKHTDDLGDYKITASLLGGND